MGKAEGTRKEGELNTLKGGGVECEGGSSTFLVVYIVYLEFSRYHLCGAGYTIITVKIATLLK